jgi:hypothetical protein
LLESGQGAENFGLDPQLLFRASTRLTIFAAIRRAASLLIGLATNASVCTGAVNAAQTHPTLVRRFCRRSVFRWPHRHFCLGEREAPSNTSSIRRNMPGRPMAGDKIAEMTAF